MPIPVSTVTPTGRITRPAVPVAVTALVTRWPGFPTMERTVTVDGVAVAWTSEAVRVRWEWDGVTREEWLAVGAVSRR